MKERPILFSGPMVRAILEGRKTQTRRVVKQQAEYIAYVGKDMRNLLPTWGLSGSGGPSLITCPHGQPGDRTWVRETCQIYGNWKKNGLTKTGKQKWRFCPHHSHKVIHGRESFEPQPRGKETLGWWTRPNIFMPRWASRILLEVVSVRVERACEADNTSILKEGIQKATKDGDLYKYGLEEWPWSDWQLNPLAAWRKLWIQINGQQSWDANPWVWVVEFKQI